MTPPLPLYHALLRPAVLQILRATGFHSAKPSVLDSLTDLATRYFLVLCQTTARFAALNGSEIRLLGAAADDDDGEEQPSFAQEDGEDGAGWFGGGGGGGGGVGGELAPTIVDIRMALQYVGALLPERLQEEQDFTGAEDLRGLEAFLSWVTGPQNQEIKRVALDGDEEALDYLDAIKKKHSKTDDDTKYTGTLLGKSIEHGDVLVEGGQFENIHDWEAKMREAGRRKTPEVQQVEVGGDGDADADADADSRPGSSGLSSLGDKSIPNDMDDMDLS